VKITNESNVRTTGGLVQGWCEDGFEHWRGIPYAAPPVGPGRFRAPAPVKPWEGTLPATQYGAAPWPTEFSCSFALGIPRTTTNVMLDLTVPAAREALRRCGAHRQQDHGADRDPGLRLPPGQAGLRFPAAGDQHQ
jgi:hypothetical protein